VVPGRRRPFLWSHSVVDTRQLLERLEAEGGEPTAALAWVAMQSVKLDPAELAAARRRALLLLASSGDPRRDLDPDSRAVASLAADLDRPERRAALDESIAALRAQAEGLPAVASSLDALEADGGLAWTWAACGLLAEELAE
jgi:hypothetical protein